MRSFPCAALAVALSILVLEGPTAHAGKGGGTAAYTVLDMGVGVPQAINASGTVAGFVYPPVGGRVHATVWRVDAGAVTKIPLPEIYAWASNVSGINASGQVTGYAVVGLDSDGHSIPHPVVWNPDGAGGYGAPVDLWTLAVPSDLGILHIAGARGINDHGVIVGSARLDINSFGGRAVLLRPTGAQTYDAVNLNSLLPAGSGWVLETASRINNAGVVLGSGRLAGVARPFLLETNVIPAAITDLGALTPGMVSATGLNNLGHVAGVAPANTKTSLNAYFWNGTSMTEIAAITKEGNRPSAVNDSDAVVGSAIYPLAGWPGWYTSKPFLWRDGVTTDLASLVSVKNIKLLGARDINGSGQIAVYGELKLAAGLEPHVIRLTPN